MKRIILIVLDSVGCGELPDAPQYGDEGSNTLGHIIAREHPALPHMEKMGLGLIPSTGAKVPEKCVGVWGRAREISAGKDTTTGHWEIAGLKLDTPFPTYPEGFPPEVMEAFEKAIGTRTLGNKPASGTAILDELGEEHLRTGYPIVYTSADSVFQIAANESLYPPEKLYEMCRIARGILQGKHGVGRVIARPFIGEKAGHFTRTGRRRDFSLPPTGKTLLKALQEAGIPTGAIGKIEDIFDMDGIDFSDHASGNPACIDSTLKMMDTLKEGLLFVNLVDFDSTYGHRRDVKGYGEALAYFDSRLPEIMEKMGEEDLLILTADHGCDPTFLKTTDHTREYIPLLCWSKKMNRSLSIGTRQTFADIAATAGELLGIEERFSAQSFAREIKIAQGEIEMNPVMETLKAAAQKIEETCGKAEIGIVLGSGLGNYAENLEDAVRVPYGEIPGFPTSTAPGHAGCWWAGKLHGKKVYMMQGRFHGYEGYDLSQVTLYVRVMKLLGVQTLILTNAAGGVNLDFAAGDLMLVTDYINFSGKNPLTGPNLEEFGPRFPDMSRAYCKELQELAQQVAEEKGIKLQKGVYVWLNGPCYETPAEIRMARLIGGDAVGMSTVPETIVANHCGMKVLGLSCITNMAAGIQSTPLNHLEVLQTGERVKETFKSLVDGIVEKL